MILEQCLGNWIEYELCMYNLESSQERKIPKSNDPKDGIPLFLDKKKSDPQKPYYSSDREQ